MWHDGIIFNLTKICISEILINLLQDTLKKRKQRAVLKGEVSAWKNIRTGVQQVSILGYLFFSIYVNERSEGLSTNEKLFSDNNSSSIVIHDTEINTNNLKNELYSRSY